MSTLDPKRALVKIHGAASIHPLSIDGSYARWYDDNGNSEYKKQLTNGDLASVWDLIVFYDVSTLVKRQDLVDKFYNKYFTQSKQSDFTYGFQEFTTKVMKDIGAGCCTHPDATAITLARDVEDAGFTKKACWKIQAGATDLRN